MEGLNFLKCSTINKLNTHSKVTVAKQANVTHKAHVTLGGWYGFNTPIGGNSALRICMGDDRV